MFPIRHLARFLLASIVLTSPVMLHAAKLGIVAVVGEEPITHLDVSERTQLIVRSSGLENTPEVQKRIALQSLRQLVDERLQAQEASKRNVAISNEEMATAIADVEQRNQQAPGSLRNFMLAQGVSWEAFLGQLRAQLVWNKMVGRVIRPKVRISEQELARAAEGQRYAKSSTEYNITPLVLPVTSPEDEEATRQLAEQVIAEIRSGASLERVMQQLMSIPVGDEPRFWVSVEQMEPVLGAALADAAEAEVLGPIRSSRGYHIMRVNQIRSQGQQPPEAELSQVILKQVLLGVAPDASQTEVGLTMQIAQQVAQNPGSCLQPTIAGIDAFAGTDIRVSFLQSMMDELPPYALQQAKNLAVGEVGKPFATQEGIRFYILCEKVSTPVSFTASEELRDSIFRERLELEIAKFMRKLRRETFVDIRV